MPDSKPAAVLPFVAPPLSEAQGPSDVPPAARAKPRRGRPFQPGNQLGVKGRPKTDTRLKAALEQLSMDGVKEMARLLRDPKTPRAVKARICEYAIDRRLGRPTTAIGGVDGQPLVPGAPTDNPISQLIARVLARKSAAAPVGGQDTTADENAQPGANGEAPDA